LHLDILFFSFLLDISFRSEELMVFFVFWRGWGYGCCRYGLSLKRSMGASHEHVKIR
jgi:hypothetical protein